MAKITDEKYSEIKKEALELFKNNRKISCSCFWGIDVKLSPSWFNHLEWQREWHKRSKNEAFMRYLCFKHIKYILNNSILYQEYKEELKEFSIKRKWKKVKVKKIVEYFWIVAIVNNNKNRVKVVIAKTEGWWHYEFISVVPYWSNSGYNKLFYEENIEK